MLTYCGGEALRKRRVEIDLSISDVVKKLYPMGVDIHDDTLRNWEDNKGQPDADQIPALARVLGWQLSAFYRNNR